MLAGQLGDEHRVGLVVADVVVIGGAAVPLERRQVALRVERAAHRHGVGRALGVPGGFLVAHPLHAHRASELLGQERGLEAGVVGGGAAVRLRPLHPHHAHLIPRDLEERRDAVAQPVRLHVVRVDRHLPVRRVGHRVRGPDRGVALVRHVVIGLDTFAAALRAASGSPVTAGGPLKVGVAARM